MSRHYEFLDDEFAELITTREDILDIAEEQPESDIDRGFVLLVIGNPYDAAAVLGGTREEIAAILHRYLTLVE